MVDKVYFTQELLKLFTMKNKMIEVFVGDLVALIKDDELADFMMDVCSDEDNLAQYGMNFKIVAHYASPYIKRTYEPLISMAWDAVGIARTTCMINSTPQAYNFFAPVEDDTNYDVFVDGILIASSDEIKASLYNGEQFKQVISQRVIQNELKESKIVAFLH